MVTSLSQYVLKVYSEQLGRNFLVNALLDMTLLLNCSRADAARGASPHRHHAAGVPQEIKNVDADTLLQKVSNILRLPAVLSATW